MQAPQGRQAQGGTAHVQTPSEEGLVHFLKSVLKELQVCEAGHLLCEQRVRLCGSPGRERELHEPAGALLVRRGECAAVPTAGPAAGQRSVNSPPVNTCVVISFALFLILFSLACA